MHKLSGKISGTRPGAVSRSYYNMNKPEKIGLNIIQGKKISPPLADIPVPGVKSRPRACRGRRVRRSVVQVLLQAFSSASCSAIFFFQQRWHMAV